MKNKIIFVILILLFFGNFSHAVQIDTVYYNGDFMSQVYDNCQNKDRIYNNSTNTNFEDKTYITDKNYIIMTSSATPLFSYDNSDICFLDSSGSFDLKNGYFNNLRINGTLNQTQQTVYYSGISLYHSNNIYQNNTGTSTLYYPGSIFNSAIYVNDNNEGSIVVYIPQVEPNRELYLYIYENNTLINEINLQDEKYMEYRTDNRFYSFIGDEIEILGITKEQTLYSIRNGTKSTNGSFLSRGSTPLFLTNGNTGTGGEGGEDTGGNIDTGKIEEELGNINSSIQQGNDYIMQDAVYDENGNLAEEQTGLIGKILQGFWNVLIKFFDWLMVPDEDQISDLVDDVLENDLIKESVLGLPLQLITRFLDLFKNRTYTDWVIAWDDVNFTFTEKDGSEIDMKMFNAYTFNISEFVRNDETLSKIYSYYLILVNFGAVCGLIYWGSGLVKGLLGIEEDMPGANDETESPAVNSTPEESGESDAEALERWLGNNYNDYTHDYDEIRKRRLAKGLPNHGYKSQVVGRYKSILSDMKAGRYKKK